jgi:hypothetical protein
MGSAVNGAEPDETDPCSSYAELHTSPNWRNSVDLWALRPKKRFKIMAPAPAGPRAVRKRRGGDPHQASMERSIQAVFSWICMR